MIQAKLFNNSLFAFVVVAGLCFYFAGVLWSALFIVVLPQDQGWCQSAQQFQTGESASETRCVKFKNTLEELKYYRNLETAERNRYWVYGQLVAGAIAGWLVLHKWPSRSNVARTYASRPAGAAVSGMTVAFIAPLVLSWLLPSPDTWFPKRIVDHSTAKLERELEVLRATAIEIDKP